MRRCFTFACVLATMAGVAMAPVALAHPNVDPGASTAAPSSASTTGDYATDVFGDPWDFSNDEDVLPVAMVGSENGRGISRDGDGWLRVQSVPNTTIKLVRTWGLELPWGRDGLRHPVDAGTYTRLSFSMCTSGKRNLGIHFWNAQGGSGLYNLEQVEGCRVYDIDLRDASKYPHAGLQTPWAGTITRLEILDGGGWSSNQITIALDWVRLRRADAPVSPPSGLPIARILTPNEEGGVDYATENGNPWDMSGPDDVLEAHDMVNVSFANGEMYATSNDNDAFIDLPLRTPFNTDRYHRATFEVCYDGAMSFADAPGGGMNARVAWYPTGGPAWSETQDIVVYPGCQRVSIDLATNPPAAVNDENTIFKFGWRGQSLAHLRIDLNEDPGIRHMTVRDVKFADDAAFSGTYPITFIDAAGAAGVTADIYATLNDGAYDGVKIASNVPVHGGVNTFTWNGKDAAGNTMPNATYSIWMVMKNASGVASNYASGPLRIERPVPPTPSYFVPINPVRVMDTRTGEGGNIVPLGDAVFTELDVTGVKGLPETGMTAVVMNVTAADPTSSGFISVWPSGEPRPLVASLNFLPGQIVPNLVTVKVGANGKVDIFNSSGQTAIIADVMGYYTDTPPAGGGRFTSLTPARILDTRDGTGVGRAGPVAGGTWIDVPVTGIGGVPSSGVSGVALNVTVTDPSYSGFLSVWPTGEARPFTATHNFVPNLTVGNLVLAKVGAGGKVSIFNSAGYTQVVADVVGYFSASGGAFVPVNPARLLDTRDGTGGVSGQVGTDGTIDVALATGSPVPAGAKAVVVNVISVDSSSTSYVTAWPSGSGRPLAATMNPRPGVPVPNQAYLKLGPGGKLSLYNFIGSTDLVIDVFGYIT